MKYFTAMCLWLTLPLTSWGQSVGLDGLENRKLQVELIVNSDGSYDETVFRSARISDEATLQRWTQMRIALGPTMQALKISAAEIVKKNGARFPIAIQETASAAGGGGTRKTTPRVLTLSMDRAEVGDLIELRIVKPHAPLLGQNLSLNYHFSPDVPVGEGEIVVKLPQDLKVNVDFGGFDSSVITKDGRQRVYKLAYRNASPTRAQPISTDIATTSPHLVISSFRNYAELGRAIDKPFFAAKAVTPAVSNMATAITLPSDTPLQAARKLYRWVQNNIRYTDQVMLADGISPHSADTILATRHGDCKAHAVLLGALLAARSIQSTPVLLSAENNFQLSNAPTAQAFNHVVTFIPSLGLYLDSTSNLYDFGALPPNLLGKPALHLDTRKMQQIPSSSLKDRFTVNTTLHFASSGAFTGKSTTIGEESLALEIRRMESAFRGDTAPIIKAALTKQGVVDAQGSIRFSPGPVERQHIATLTFTGKNVMNPAQAGKLALNTYMRTAHSLSTYAQNYSMAQRTRGFLCGAYSSDESYDIVFPDNISIEAIPKNVTYRQKDVVYSSVYTYAGNRLTIRRSLQNRSAATACAASAYAPYHAVSKVLLDDLNATVSFKPK